MAEEEVEKEEVQEEQEEEKPSGVEDLATRLGWNPNHEGGDRPFKSAEEFILGSKDIQDTQTKQNRSLKREINELKRGLGDIKTHNETVFKVQMAALKSRNRELESLKKEAVADGDTATVTQIDNQIKEINAIPNELPAGATEPTKEFVDWEEANPWYGDNNEMRDYADTIGKEYMAQNLPMGKVLELVAKKAKEVFPENFETRAEPKKIEPKPKVPAVAAVEGAGSKAASGSKPKSKYTFDDLSDNQKEICKFNVKHKLMTQEEYIKDLEIIEKNQGRV